MNGSKQFAHATHVTCSWHPQTKTEHADKQVVTTSTEATCTCSHAGIYKFIMHTSSWCAAARAFFHMPQAQGVQFVALGHSKTQTLARFQMVGNQYIVATWAKLSKIALCMESML